MRVIRRPGTRVGPIDGKNIVTKPMAGESAAATSHDTSDPWRPSSEAVQAATPPSKGAPPAAKTATLEAGTAKPGKINFGDKNTDALTGPATETLINAKTARDTRGGMSPITHAEHLRRKIAKPVTLAGKMYPSSRGSLHSRNGDDY